MAREFWYWLTSWWYSEKRRGYHPGAWKDEQPFWCALVSLVLGPKVSSGVAQTWDGPDHWWRCERCGDGDSTL